jgi:hypothetical protein
MEKKRIIRIILIVLILSIVLALTSCNPKACPAYAKNSIEKEKNI